MVVNHSQLVPPMILAQTKRTDVGLWCKDDSNALGLGVLPLLMVVGAESTTHHGRGENPGWNLSEISTVPRYVGIVLIQMLLTQFHLILYLKSQCQFGSDQLYLLAVASTYYYI